MTFCSTLLNVTRFPECMAAMVMFDLSGLFFIGHIQIYTIMLNLFGNSSLLGIYDRETTLP